MNYDMKQSGERIRQLRIKNDFTQEMMAEALGIDRSFYSRIEAGKSGCSVDLFVQLSALFRVSLDFLILGKYSKDLVDNMEKLQLKKKIEEAINRLEEIKNSF